MLERSRKEIDFLKILRKREAKERATFLVFLVFALLRTDKNGQKLPKYALNDVSKVNSFRVSVQFFYINWTVIDVSFKKCISLREIIDERHVSDSVINICT